MQSRHHSKPKVLFDDYAWRTTWRPPAPAGLQLAVNVHKTWCQIVSLYMFSLKQFGLTSYEFYGFLSIASGQCLRMRFGSRIQSIYSFWRLISERSWASTSICYQQIWGSRVCAVKITLGALNWSLLSDFVSWSGAARLSCTRLMISLATGATFVSF